MRGPATMLGAWMTTPRRLGGALSSLLALLWKAANWVESEMLVRRPGGPEHWLALTQAPEHPSETDFEGHTHTSAFASSLPLVTTTKGTVAKVLLSPKSR